MIHDSSSQKSKLGKESRRGWKRSICRVDSVHDDDGDDNVRAIVDGGGVDERSTRRVRDRGTECEMRLAVKESTNVQMVKMGRHHETKWL